MSRYEWNSKYILKTPNTNLAVSLVDMKAYLKIGSAVVVEDDFITELIEAATLEAEQYTGIEILNKTFTMYLDFFPFYKKYGNRVEENFLANTIEVKRSKLKSITHIKYYIDEVLTTFGNTLYDFTKDNQFSRIYILDEDTIWPSTDSREQSVEIELVAGNGADDTEVPKNLKIAIKRIVSYLYANRGDCVGAKGSGCNVCILAGAAPILNLEAILEI